MFSRLVDEYRLMVSDREIRAYNALIAGRVDTEEATEIFEHFDHFVNNELHNFWAYAGREMSSYERNRTLELAERFCPCRDFWKISIMGRLHDPKLVTRYLNYELMMLRECDVGGLQRDYATDLIAVYEHGYDTVQAILFGSMD